MDDIFNSDPRLKSLQKAIYSEDSEACSQALQILRESAENGNLEHLHFLIDEWMDGGELNGHRPDFTLARHFARLAMEQDSNHGRLALARICQNGWNGEPEPEKAEALYKALEGTGYELQATFYRSHPYASVVDYLEYLIALKQKR